MKVVFTAEVDLIFPDADHLPDEEDREKVFEVLAAGLERYLRTPQLDVRAKITRVWSE